MEGSATFPGCLVEIDTGQTFVLTADLTSVGRIDPRTGISPDIDLSDLDPERSISRRHAVIRRSAVGHCAVVDEKGAMNGTYLNGVRLPPGQLHPLRVGDFVVFGLVGFRVAAAPESASPPLPRAPAGAVEAGAKRSRDRSAQPAPASAGASYAFGLNENVEIDGTIHHTQTEDLGWEAEQILTIVYTSGSILMSKKTPYSFFYERLGADAKPAEMVRFQHRGMIVGLKKGKVLTRGPRPLGDTHG